MQTDIVFVNPNLTLWERYGNDLSKGGSSLPPLGIALLASIVRDKGYSVKIIDSVALGHSTKETINAIMAENPRYIGITAVTAAIPKAMEVAAELKKSRPDVPILLGGAHITTLPDETMKLYEDFDIGAIGECETTILELLDSLDNKKDLSNVNGIIFRNNGDLVKTQQRDLLKDLDQLPFPAWDLLPSLSQYYQPAANCFYQLPSGSLISSRGCPCKCTFCDRTMSGSKLRSFSADYTIKMVEKLYYDHGIKDIFFYDDNFTVFKNRLVEFCNTLIKKKMDFTWACLGRVDMVNPDMLKLMKEAGCWQIGYGIESGSQRILDSLKKGTTIEQIRQAVKWTKEAGIQVRGTFMIGIPTETKETIEATRNFILDLPLDDFHLFTFNPMPGLEILNDIEKHGSFDSDVRKQTGWWFNFIPNGFTKEELQDYHKLIFKEFYFRPRIIFNYIMRGIKNPRKLIYQAKNAFTLWQYTHTKGE